MVQIDSAIFGNLLFLIFILVLPWWLWRRRCVENSLKAAKVIRRHQGNHEAEVSCGGESDLHRHYRKCKKNPDHSQFIPIQEFKMAHLPPGYRDNDILDFIRNEADLTCRVSVRYTSKNRPRFHSDRETSPYPFYQDRGGDWLRTGTGWVFAVHKYTEEDGRECECKGCCTPGSLTPNKVWGEVEILTASHVVYDNDEARHTTCEFFYDTSTTQVSQCPTLTGLIVESSFIEANWCKMTYVSHDMDTIDGLYEMYRRRNDHWKNLQDKYKPYSVSCLTDPTPEPVVIISHPHGCSKMVTVGMWTDRKTVGEKEKYTSNEGWQADRMFTSYTYNAPTCRGSSGAPVIILPRKGKWWSPWNYHPHSEGRQANINKSGLWIEFVTPPTSV